jgi:hypothetical protein
VIRRAAQRGVDWFVWRVVTHERVPDGLAAIREWSFADLVDAHHALDAIEALEPRAVERR